MQVVGLGKKNGDGCGDRRWLNVVSMIMEAHIGVGIRGKKGTQVSESIIHYNIGSEIIRLCSQPVQIPSGSAALSWQMGISQSLLLSIIISFILYVASFAITSTTTLFLSLLIHTLIDRFTSTAHSPSSNMPSRHPSHVSSPLPFREYNLTSLFIQIGSQSSKFSQISHFIQTSPY